MSNPYITGSKLSDEEVKQCVWNLVWFLPYPEVFREVERSPQALRPLLMRIERRMYFEMDAWPFFHMTEFEKHNLNRAFRPYVNYVDAVIDFVHRIPRASDTKMKIVAEPIDFADETACLFDCPQHLPPKKFVGRYGLADPMQNTAVRAKLDDECWNRLQRKRHCLKCRSKLTAMWTGKNSFFFRYAMEYAADRGKPRHQHADLFIARLAYHLVWRAYELNLRAWLFQKQLALRFKARGMSGENGEAYFEEGIRQANQRTLDLYLQVKRHIAHLVLNDLRERPLRIDRRRTQRG